MKNGLLTAHCMLRNEEYFAWYAIKSVIDHVDQIIIFDTGSTDRTVQIVHELIYQYPDKIIFEQKGVCDKVRHTALRNEMIRRTTTKWFMLLDGDEIWSDESMKEISQIISEPGQYVCGIAPLYLCVGDIYHYSIKGKNGFYGKNIHGSLRFYKNIPGVHFLGAYGEGDFLVDSSNEIFYTKSTTFMSKHRFWHASTLERSPDDHSVHLGRHKAVMTYSLKLLGMGFPIPKSVNIPKAFTLRKSPQVEKLTPWASWKNLFLLIQRKCRNYYLSVQKATNDLR